MANTDIKSISQRDLDDIRMIVTNVLLDIMLVENRAAKLDDDSRRRIEAQTRLIRATIKEILIIIKVAHPNTSED
jgi:hypothetical protein